MQRARLFLLAGIALMMVLMPGRAVAQTPTGTAPSIVTTGVGNVSGPLAAATLQFLVGSSMAFGGGGMMFEPPVAGPGTPNAVESEMIDPYNLTEQTLDPMVDAIVAAGVAAEDVVVTVPAASEAFGGFGGPVVGEIRVELNPATVAQVVNLVDTARDTAPSAGLSILHIGATFEPVDCETLVQSARDAAIADALQRAEGLAQSLGGSLGALIQASESPYYGQSGPASCDPAQDSLFGPFGPGSLPSFDPRSTDPEVYVQVSLTYEFVPGE